MKQAELIERIERFRTTFLDKDRAEEYRLVIHWEQSELRRNYAEIQDRRLRGEDVTSLVLDKLLPHTDTHANRNRDVHISHWGTITKNIRVWFETMKWKTAEEWPAAALWILDMIEAGRTEDWETWNSRATEPIQKGFACGFLTPIVYSLNREQLVINTKVLKTYAQFSKALEIKEKISPSLTEYRDNRQRLYDMIAAAQPLGIKSQFQWDIYCVWNLSKRLNGETSNKI